MIIKKCLWKRSKPSPGFGIVYVGVMVLLFIHLNSLQTPRTHRDTEQ